ncbi:hypothetical protein Tco_1043842 [Tanacetum coccineum]|uniref:Uncharacterized protein n=1 Tax=Tanacetum coccineum TaxID=301880 RepID=A0ABQ5GN82_9ASTR
MGSGVVVVHALKEEEFAQITILGVQVSFHNGMTLSFMLRQVPTVFPVGIHLRPTEVKILHVGFHVRSDLGGVVFMYTAKDLFGENLCPVEIRLSCFLASLFYSTGQECGVIGFVNAFFSTTSEANRDFENEDRSDLNAVGYLITG